MTEKAQPTHFANFSSDRRKSMSTSNRIKTCSAIVVAGSVWAGALVSAPQASAALTYTTGLDVWLDASDMNGNGDGNLGWTNGEALSTAAGQRWVNKGTAGNPTQYGATGSNPPTNSTGAPVYRSSISYPSGGTGAAVEFTKDSLFLPEFMNSPSVSIFAVIQKTGNGAGRDPIFWDYGTNGNETIIFGTSSGTGFTANTVNAFTRDNGGDNINAIDDTDLGSSVQIVQMFVSGTTVEAGPLGSTTSASNANYSTTTDWDGTFNGPGSAVGAFALKADSGSNYFDGYIVELLIFDTALTGANRTAVETYLHEKYVVPEPGSLALLGLGGLCLIQRRRRN